MKIVVFLFSLLLPGFVPPIVAQTQECMQLSQQLLTQLGSRSPTESMDATVRQQREILASQGCDPLSTGYDVEAEGMRLNQQMNLRPPGKDGFRLDQLIRIDY
ncbi:hypothetical protein KQ302_07415 [Synechococcus sp. CS-602]|uniref:hypothetical protein n=1 Tax=Synechococcaceae TaxID=1890426 RepID=UPI00119C9910|nr:MULTISPECIES: hypothetical protein [Synechococcaceae]MCT4363745.1 hypothetical protein [Candidatus Regnicoccus frigidus MAG-AL1]MCT0200980.1 hypothetical protein [Synechococcus sp. CS-603]MCT0204926.1 hypothetical protein [Synechococcus sp. CS-602]MCT0244754.1 hypothetical protein [Synechococcus sp. CS-601]MCT4367570.1 hypothetical protein [Candidatus Regnicoccus frigidus MAG-AL2]